MIKPILLATSVSLFALGTAHAQQPAQTTDSGAPVADNQNSITAGEWGGVQLEDFRLIEKLARFDRERIPERVVHARGTGAEGNFVVTNNAIAEYTAASLFSDVGEETPVFVRFSTVVHPKGSPEGLRDPRGFAIKFYTDEGNWDLVGNNLPVFFIRDAIKFPDMVHSLKPSPVTNQQDPNRFFDFFSHIPESTHMITQVYTDLGTPEGYQYMDGNSVHALRLVNADGESVFAKFRWTTDQGVRTLSASESGSRPFNYATQSLYDDLNAGNAPSWTLKAIILRPENIENLDYNPFDATKDWPDEGDTNFETIEIGTMTLNTVPDNFFESTEQSAFAPSVMVPGIQPSPDRLLQGRLFSYADTQRYRVGTNYLALPVNAPLTDVRNGSQDGSLSASSRSGEVNYQPSRRTDGAYTDGANAVEGAYDVSGLVERAAITEQNPFQQAGEFYNSLSRPEKRALISNLSGDLAKVESDEIREIMVSHFYQADEDYGRRLARAVNVDIDRAIARIADGS